MFCISYLQQLCSDLEGLVNEHPNTQIWIAGDLNFPNINWNNNSVEGFSYPIPLVIFFTSTCLYTVNLAIRAKNTLDKFCTNRPSFVNRYFLISDIGDHDAVAVESSTMLH